MWGRICKLSLLVSRGVREVGHEGAGTQRYSSVRNFAGPVAATCHHQAGCTIRTGPQPLPEDSLDLTCPGNYKRRDTSAKCSGENR
jgi:hypothetical protein